MEVTRCQECKQLFQLDAQLRVKEKDKWEIKLCPLCRLAVIQRGVADEAE